MEGVMCLILSVLRILLLVGFDAVFSVSIRSLPYQSLKPLQDSQVINARGQWYGHQTPAGAQSLRQQLASDVFPSGVQYKQDLINPVSQLLWKFPTISEEPAPPLINFELIQPGPPNSVAVQCLEDGVHVEVNQDFFGTGQLLEPALFSLGGCAAVDMDAAAGILIFQSALQDCGSEQLVTEDELVYLFTIEYTAAAFLGTPVVRSSSATVDIECHYPRRHNVSSDGLQPAWIPFASNVASQEVLVFSLALMTADWLYERPSNVFFLGNVLNVQAAVKQYYHVPLRVFVDHCAATATPDMNSSPLYSFIENHGCLTDAKYTGSSSKFLPRVQDNKVQFQLESFRFQHESSGDVYITCLLKAVLAASPIDGLHKACSFQTNGWVSSDGSDQVCSCCDTSCELSDVFPASSGFHYEGTVQVGPLHVQNFPAKIV